MLLLQPWLALATDVKLWSISVIINAGQDVGGAGAAGAGACCLCGGAGDKGAGGVAADFGRSRVFWKFRVGRRKEGRKITWLRRWLFGECWEKYKAHKEDEITSLSSLVWIMLPKIDTDLCWQKYTKIKNLDENPMKMEILLNWHVHSTPNRCLIFQWFSSVSSSETSHWLVIEETLKVKNRRAVKLFQEGTSVIKAFCQKKGTHHVKNK